ncbi:MAG: hypothetical protein FJ385_03725 [Verrucomicrobia bacterium]|nr:hypothetical protein [Verrucomicrobiota bacterium]
MIRAITNAIALVLLVSCAGDKEPVDRSSPQQAPRSLSQRLSEGGGYVQDSGGNWVPRQNKRSAYEGKDAGTKLRKTQETKDFATEAYKSKSWWGRKEYGRQSYEGGTDGSRFRKASRDQGKGAREAGSAAKVPDPYRTGQYGTGPAIESSRKPMTKPSDAETDERRRVFDAPDVVDWREQRPLTIQETRGILGR